MATKLDNNSNNNDENYCNVSIFGDIYKLVSNEYDLERLKVTANEVDRQMIAIAEKYPNFPKYKIAILVALNVTDTLLKSKSIANAKNPHISTSSENNNNAMSNATNEEIIMRVEKLIDDIDKIL